MLTRRGTNESLLELRQHAVVAEHDRHILALSAVERRTADRPFEIDGYLIAGCGRPLDRRIFHLLLTQALDHRVDVALGHIRRRALDLERLDGLQCNVGEHFERGDIG